MNERHERQARWYAIRVVMALVSIIGTFCALAYIDLFWLFITVGIFLFIMVAGAIYSDAYYTKLLELKRNERENV